MIKELEKYMERRRRVYGAVPIASGCVAMYFAWHLPVYQRFIGLGIYSVVSYICYEKAMEKTKKSKMTKILKYAMEHKDSKVGVICGKFLTWRLKKNK